MSNIIFYYIFSILLWLLVLLLTKESIIKYKYFSFNYHTKVYTNFCTVIFVLFYTTMEIIVKIE